MKQKTSLKYFSSIKDRFRSGSAQFDMILAGTSVLVFFLFMWSTPSLDDLRFRLAGEMGQVSWSDCVESYRNFGQLFVHDANRLPNYLGPAVLTLMPGWLFGLFAALLFMLAIKLGRQIIGISDSLLGSSVLLLLFISVFPWQEQIVSRMFMLNYLLGSVVILWFVKIFLYNDGTIGKWKSRLGWLLLGVVAGAIHEGLALPVLCGCTVLMIVDDRSTKRWLLMTGLLLGLLSIFLSPAIHSRTQSYNVNDFHTLLKAVIKFFYYVAPFTLFIISFGVAMLFQRFRQTLTHKRRIIFTFLIISGFSSIGFCFIPLGLRVFTMAYWAAILGWPLFLMSLFGACGIPSRRFVRMAVIACGIFIFTQLGVSLYYQRQLYCDFNSAYNEAKNGIAVSYVRYPLGYPMFLLHHTSAGATLAGEYFLKHYSEHIGAISDKASPELSILPDVLQDFSVENARQIPSYADYYQYKGLVISDGIIDEQIGRADVVDSSGSQSAVKTYILHFTGKDGHTYSALVPAYFCYINRNFPEDIVKIELAKF